MTFQSIIRTEVTQIEKIDTRTTVSLDRAAPSLRFNTHCIELSFRPSRPHSAKLPHWLFRNLQCFHDFSCMIMHNFYVTRTCCLQEPFTSVREEERLQIEAVPAVLRSIIPMTISSPPPMTKLDALNASVDQKFGVG